MFLMGEEVGAQKPFTYNRFYEDKEDLLELRATTGAPLFQFYSEIIRFRLSQPPARSRNIEVVAANDAGRVIAFRRWDDTSEQLVVASLANEAYDDYGGNGIGNRGATLQATGGSLDLVLPANGFVVFGR